MGCNAEWEQGLQEVCAQRRASLSQETTVVQALQGKEALLADIREEEKVHQTPVSVLSQLHLQQAEEVKVQLVEIKHLSPLLKRQQSILEKVQESQSLVPEMLHPQQLTSHLEELQR